MQLLCRAWEIANGHSCTRGGSALGPGEKWGTAVAPGGDSCATPHLGPTTVPVHFPQTKVAGRVSRLAPWCGGGGTVSSTARHQAANIHSVSALLPGGAAWCSQEEEGKEWLAPRWADWLAAPWRQLPVCPATLCCWRRPPNFPLHLPTTASLLALTRTLAGHIRSACEACCGGPCYAHQPTTTTTIPRWRKCC